jgi:hypothetical protein
LNTRRPLVLAGKLDLTTAHVMLVVRRCWSPQVSRKLPSVIRRRRDSTNVYWHRKVV